MKPAVESDVFVELHVPNFQKAIDFYKILGFEVVWLSDDYLVMRKGKSILNFHGGDKKVYEHPYFGNFPKNTKRGYAVEIFFLIDNIKKFYKEIKDKVKVVEELKLKPWGHWDFRIEDCFGFYLRFGDNYNWVNEKASISKTKEIAKKKGIKL